MELKKIHIVIVASLSFLGFWTMVTSGIGISNQNSCKDDSPLEPTPGCNYQEAQNAIFLIAGLLSLLGGPLGFFLTPRIFIGPGVFAAMSIIMNVVYMLRYRTNNNWQFQPDENKKYVWQRELNFFAMSSILFMFCFILYFLGLHAIQQRAQEEEGSEDPKTKDKRAIEIEIPADATVVGNGKSRNTPVIEDTTMTAMTADQLR